MLTITESDIPSTTPRFSPIRGKITPTSLPCTTIAEIPTTINDTPIAGADGRALAQAVSGAVFADSVAALPAAIRQTVRGGDVLITMGAGSIAAVPKQLMGAAA